MCWPSRRRRWCTSYYAALPKRLREAGLQYRWDATRAVPLHGVDFVIAAHEVDELYKGDRNHRLADGQRIPRLVPLAHGRAPPKLNGHAQYGIANHIAGDGFGLFAGRDVDDIGPLVRPPHQRVRSVDQPRRVQQQHWQGSERPVKANDKDSAGEQYDKSKHERLVGFLIQPRSGSYLGAGTN